MRCNGNVGHAARELARFPVPFYGILPDLSVAGDDTHETRSLAPGMAATADIDAIGPAELSDHFRREQSTHYTILLNPVCNDFGNHIPYSDYLAAFSQIRAPVVFPTAAPNLEPRDDIWPTETAQVDLDP
jgi:hypothetical protein